MARWCTCHAAVRWILLLFLVAPTSAQITKPEENLTEAPFYTEITTEYSEATTNDLTTKISHGNNMKRSDSQRSERMVVVYVKPDPDAATKNISDILDSDDVILETKEDGTIILKDSTGLEDEVQHDGDHMQMEGRSLKNNFDEDQFASEAGEFESKKQPVARNNDSNVKDTGHLFKWNREFDFNISDILKINIASLLADEYAEMNRLMNENLVEDKNASSSVNLAADDFEPRGFDASSDIDQTAEGTEEVVQQLNPQNTAVPTNLQQRGQTSLYASQGIISPNAQPFGPVVYLYRPTQRADTGPSHIYVPRIGKGQPMALLPARNTMPNQALPRTVAQRTQATTVASTRPTIRRPQTSVAAASSNQITSGPAGRFGERFASRLPRPFQYMYNMTLGARQTTKKTRQSFHPSSVAHLPSPSQNYPARVRAPNRFSQPSTLNNLPPSPTMIRNEPKRVPAAPVPDNRNTRLRMTTTAPSSQEFGTRTRFRSFLFERQRNSTNVTNNVERKVQREMQINHLRSNLVGKLVVMQSVIHEKKENSENKVKQRGQLAATRLNRKGLPNGILKPIVPLQPRVTVETTTASVASTETVYKEVTTETTLVFKDKKKYRRPPSFRKGGNYKLSAEKQTQDANPASHRESMIVLKTATVTLPNQSSPTKNDDQQTSTSSTTVVSELNETALPINNTDSITQFSGLKNDDQKTAGTFPDIVDMEETAFPANFTENANTTETTTQSTAETKNDNGDVTPTAFETEVASQSEETIPPAANSSEITLDEESTTVTVCEDIVETEHVSVEYATETLFGSIQNEEQLNSTSQLVVSQMVDTSLFETSTENSHTSVQNNNVSGSTSISNPEPVTDLVDTSLPAGIAAENLSVQNANISTSTYAPEDDPYMKAMIERALQLSDEEIEPQGKFATVDDVTPENQDEINSAADLNDFVDDDSMDDENDSDLDFPDLETVGGISRDNEKGLNTDNILLRSDRSVGSSSKVPKKAVDSSAPSNLPEEQTLFATSFARRVMRPINLPYNILSDSTDATNQRQASDRERQKQGTESDHNQSQVTRSEHVVPAKSDFH